MDVSSSPCVLLILEIEAQELTHRRIYSLLDFSLNEISYIGPGRNVPAAAISKVDDRAKKMVAIDFFLGLISTLNTHTILPCEA
jgi:hypothetical protein